MMCGNRILMGDKRFKNIMEYFMVVLTPSGALINFIQAQGLTNELALSGLTSLRFCQMSVQIQFVGNFETKTLMNRLGIWFG